MPKIFSWLLLLLLISCKPQHDKYAFLKEGDLLFQNLNCGELCDAIEAVTEGVAGKDFSHCAIVAKINDSLQVLEAIGSGVTATPVDKFFVRSGDSVEIKNITVGRLKNEYSSLIEPAVAYCKKQIHKPYDKEFLLNNDQFYCSELLYEAFKSANHNQDFFSLAPMTFKVPGKNEFFPARIKYYEDLQASIPEGALGLNPGSISRSDKITIVKN